MKRSNLKLEWRVLRTMCDEQSPALVGSLSNDLFGTEVTLEVYRKLSNLLQLDQELPRFRDIPDVISLSSDSETALRTLISDPDGLPRTLGPSTDKAISRLREQLNARIAADCQAELTSKLNDSETAFDADKAAAMLEKTASKMSRHAVTKPLDLSVDFTYGPWKPKTKGRMLQTVFEALNEKLHGGLYFGKCSGWAAPTKGAKSMVMERNALDAAVNQGLKVGYFSNELDRNELLQRAIASQCHAPLWKVMSPTVPLDTAVMSTWDDVLNRMDLSGGSFRIYDTNWRGRRITIPDIVRESKAQGFNLIVVDYIQICQQIGDKFDNKRAMLGEDMLALHAFVSKQTEQGVDCHCMVGNQLNKQGDSREGMEIEFGLDYIFKWEFLNASDTEAENIPKSQTLLRAHDLVKDGTYGNVWEVPMHLANSRCAEPCSFAAMFDCAFQDVSDVHHPAPEMSGKSKTRKSNNPNVWSNQTTNPKKTFDHRCTVCDPDTMEFDD